ncbi:Fic family protein [Xanthomonas campestris pv. campestris]|uniref:Fic/DOC family protein n=1 Tax=Xanthomonas campestris TaxID=339 RepID=UPI001E47217A|nr:Fic family protein [Xanthomonas campestris]MCD0253080.1 Fic family protein [Xanthomonas campestris pv. campestris]
MEFDRLDAELSGFGIAEIMAGTKKLPSRLAPERLTAIHAHLFGTHLYDAGQLRTTPLLKPAYAGRAALTVFTAPDKIEPELSRLFQDLRDRDGLKGLSRLEFAEAAADVFGRCNAAHPFTEGNGRTQQTFVRLLARDAGHNLSFEAITRDRMVSASVDFSRGKPDAMRAMFDELTDPVRGARLAKAHKFLTQLQDRMGLKIEETSIATCVPGRQYSGTVLTSDTETCIFYKLPHFHVANLADIPGGKAEYGAKVAPFTATRSALEEAHHAIDLAERAAPKGRRAPAIAQAIENASGTSQAQFLQEAGQARLKAAKVRDIGPVILR